MGQEDLKKRKTIPRTVSTTVSDGFRLGLHSACLIRHEPFGKVLTKHDQEEEYGFAFENGCGGTVSTIDWFQRFDLSIIREAAFETE